MKKVFTILSLTFGLSAYATSYTCESSFVLPSGEDWMTVGYGNTQNSAAINAVEQCLRYGFGSKTCTPYVVDCWQNTQLPFAVSATWECTSLSIDNYTATSYSQIKEEAAERAMAQCSMHAEVPESCFVRCQQ